MYICFETVISFTYYCLITFVCFIQIYQFQFSTLNICLMEDLPEPLIAEIVKRTTCTSDRNSLSLSLVSKQLYKVEADERGVICVGCGLNPATEALSSLCFRFPNLWKVEINYNGWLPNQGAQLDNQGLHVLSSHCPSAPR
jgi:F-box and leucine-rich repeat protein 2/20